MGEYHLGNIPVVVRGMKLESGERKATGRSNTGHQSLQWMVLQRRCYALSVYAPTPIYMLKYSHQCDGILRWELWEVIKT